MPEGENRAPWMQKDLKWAESEKIAYRMISWWWIASTVRSLECLPTRIQEARDGLEGPLSSLSSPRRHHRRKLRSRRRRPAPTTGRLQHQNLHNRWGKRVRNCLPKTVRLEIQIYFYCICLMPFFSFDLKVVWISHMRGICATFRLNGAYFNLCTCEPICLRTAEKMTSRSAGWIKVLPISFSWSLVNDLAQCTGLTSLFSSVLATFLNS